MNINSITKRTWSALKADLVFQTKQGFLSVYIVVSVLYIIILSQLPKEIMDYVVPILIFSDPSILGLLFMGGMLMLEKEQGITQALAVTPLRFYEYIVSKAIALGAISVVVSISISLAAYGIAANYFYITVTVFLVSVMFTLIGYIVGQSCSGINQFILKSVPFIILATVPCLSLIGFKLSWLFYAFPTVSALKLIIGAYVGIQPIWAVIIILYIVAWDVLLMMLAKKTYNKNFI